MQAFCRQCSSEYASHLCLCAFPAVPICSAEFCHTNHNQKPGPHIDVPIILGNHLQTREGVQRGRIVMMQVRSADEWLTAQLLEVQKCEEDVTSYFANLIETIVNVRDKALQQIGAQRNLLYQTIEQARTEVILHFEDAAYNPPEPIQSIFSDFMKQKEVKDKKLFLMRIQNESSPVVHVASILEDEESKASASQFKVYCLKCFEKSSVLLRCGHSFCTNCFAEFICDRIYYKGFVFNHAGESAEHMICPSQSCKKSISTSELQTAFGQNFSFYTKQNGVKCIACNKQYSSSRFLLGECSCRMCIMCFSKGTPTCQSSHRFTASMAAIKYLRERKCQQCGTELSFLAGLICQDHCLCQQCLQGPSSPHQSCVICLLNYLSIWKLQSQPSQTCQSLQGNCRGTIIAFRCGCRMCVQCVKTVTSKTGRIDTCPLCSKSLCPEEIERFCLAELAEQFAMKRCNKCQNAIGDAMLICGHYICKTCFTTHINKFCLQKESTVNLLWDTIDNLGCPILGCASTQNISSNTLQMILGDNYDTQQKIAKIIKSKIVCNRCMKTSVSNCFLLLNYCGCQICVYCQIEVTKANNGLCLCGNYIHQSAMATADSIVETCASCKKSLQLTKRFTAVRCSEHNICIKCLEKAFKKPNPCCPVDSRLFTPFEINQAKKSFVRQCELYCGKFFDSSGAQEVSCGCHFCLDCAKYDLLQGKPHINCFACKTRFSSEEIVKWEKIVKKCMFVQTIKQTVKLNATNQYMAAVCPICQRRIGKVNRVSLICGHELDKECLRDYAENFIFGYDVKEIPCPVALCGTVIDAGILQRVLKGKVFTKYCDKLLEASNKLIYCPDCNFGHIAKIIEYGPKAHVQCQNCKSNFCGFCGNAWNDQHDFKRCKFDDMQKQIQILTNALTDPKDAIAQCPGCKILYIKNEHCDHMKCTNTQCLVEWCFKCSCYRNPTMEHHMAWHRPQCPRYTPPPQGDNEPMRPRCIRCQKFGRRCNPPRDLKTPCRFDFDEYDIDDLA